MSGVLRISEAVSLGLHAMVLLTRYPNQRMSNIEVSETLHASAHTLSKVFQRLSRAGLVDAVRGVKGGFRLGRAPETITLLEIFEAIDGPLRINTCLLSRPICTGKKCIFGGLAQSIQHEMRSYLSATRLADVVDVIEPP